jgi:hypothetical protein
MISAQPTFQRKEWLTHPGSVGRPIDECCIDGPDGEEPSTGQVGVVHFAGGRQFEYHGDPDKTASVAHDKGWRLEAWAIPTRPATFTSPTVPHT